MEVLRPDWVVAGRPTTAELAVRRVRRAAKTMPRCKGMTMTEKEEGNEETQEHPRKAAAREQPEGRDYLYISSQRK